MSNFEIFLLIFIFLLFITVVVLLIFLINSRNKSNDNNLNSELNKDLLSFSKQLNEDFNRLSNLTNDKLVQIEEKMNKNIIDTSKNTNEVFLKISEKMVKINEAQNSLTNISNDILSLQSILQDKKNRGTFGEIELYSLLESAFGVDNTRYAKQYKLSNDTKVDAIVFGPESLGKICIDSKFPLENYRRMYDENLSNVEKDKARTSFKNDVLKHINDIKTKYIIPGETAEVAYMFLPAEAIFAEIYGNFPEIVNKSYEEKVYIVSPTTLMAYITAIKSIYLGQKKDENAKEIKKLLQELSIEFNRLKERSENLQRDFEKIIPDFEKLALTSNKIIKKFSAINSGDIDE